MGAKKVSIIFPFFPRYFAVKPPSTTIPVPHMKLLIGDARKTMESAISSICAILPIGVCSISFLMTSDSVEAPKSGVAT
jgi:hypothetical protein